MNLLRRGFPAFLLLSPQQNICLHTDNIYIIMGITGTPAFYKDNENILYFEYTDKIADLLYHALRQKAEDKAK